MRWKFPGSLLMAPAYLTLGLLNLYAGRKEHDRGGVATGLLWLGACAVWTVLAAWDIRKAGETEELQHRENA